MPLTMPQEVKRFKFKIGSAGLPLSQVITQNGNYWIGCCPLCGHAHDLRGVSEGEFEPNCLVKTLDPKTYTAWVKLYPEAANFTRVTLVPPEG
ncbi:MAG: hypothetical protein K8J31_29725 [Anaerolineae bacterium]|nr:hypothetical protein [Anaerolineae bacterium]